MTEKERKELAEFLGEEYIPEQEQKLQPEQDLIMLARKPLSEDTIAENVLKWGTGGLNIDESRIETNEKLSVKAHEINNSNGLKYSFGATDWEVNKSGRFPANIILDEEAASLLDEQSGVVSTGHWSKSKTSGYGNFGGGNTKYNGVGIKDNSKHGASRFFYVAKVSKKERNLGLEGFEEKQNTYMATKGGTSDVASKGMERFQTQPKANHHPTCKPINLLTYLCKLITPKNGVILDPFMGSGSTGIAALLTDFNFIGMEMMPEYMKIAEARISNYEKYKDLLK